MKIGKILINDDGYEIVLVANHNSDNWTPNDKKQIDELMSSNEPELHFTDGYYIKWI